MTNREQEKNKKKEDEDHQKTHKSNTFLPY